MLEEIEYPRAGSRLRLDDEERARAIRETTGIWLIRILVVMAVAATIYYFSWWGRAGRIESGLLAASLLVAGAYHWMQLLGSWCIYLSARRRSEPAVPLDNAPSVDVFVTACNEPYELVDRALRAVTAMRGSFRPWLLDDGDDPRLAQLAERLGAGYLTRTDRIGAKAGNINAALRRTDGDLVVIFDLDHAPRPDFLERTLAHFADPEIGFVQVMLTFENQNQSWYARAAAESALDFFNPTSVGMDALGSATLIGSNAIVRRKALQSIGGYRHGLAEDLATSIELHAAGWKSAYVAEPLAPGLAPADTRAWFTQQLKWSRGVFEVLLTAYPRLWPRLTMRQRMCYAVRTTYYWIGPVTALHMAFTIGVLLAGQAVARVNLGDYIVHFLPLAACTLAIRLVALWTFRHPSVPMVPLWRAFMLVYSSWPIYTLAWFMAVLRLPLEFRLTPKARHGRADWNWLAPQALASAAIAISLLAALSAGTTPQVEILLGFCVVQALPQIVLLWHSARSFAV
jgi:cellulose synthase (UDP-forming)